MKKQSFILIWVLTTIFQATAQDHFNVAYMRTSTQLHTNSVSDFEFSFTYPHKLQSGNFLLMGINTVQYDVNNPDYKRVSLSNNMLRLGYILDQEKSKTMFLALPKLNGGNGDYSLQYGGLIHYHRKVNDNFSWTAGAMYNTDLFGNFILPMLGIKWKLSERLWIYGDLPVYMHILYSVGDKSNVGLQFRGLISSHPYSDQYYYEVSQDWICAYYEVSITENIVFQPSAGIFFIRNMNYFETDQTLNAKVAIVNVGERNQQQDPTIYGISPFIGAHLFFRVNTH